MTIEEIIELKVNVLLKNPSLGKSPVFFLDSYLQFLDLYESENEKLRLIIEKFIDDSKINYLKNYK